MTASMIALVSEVPSPRRHSGIKVSNLSMRAALHLTVENQVLRGDQTPMAATHTRPMD
jgi:hypothetical protein